MASTDDTPAPEVDPREVERWLLQRDAERRRRLADNDAERRRAASTPARELLAAAALAELATLSTFADGTPRPFDDIVADIVEGVAAMMRERDAYSRRRAIITLGALLDRDLLDAVARGDVGGVP